MSATQPSQSAAPPETVIRVRDMVKFYGDREILKGIDVDIHRGEIMVVMGGSGSGKSTFLRHIMGLERPTSGSIKVLGKELSEMSDVETTEFSKNLGVAFQGGADVALVGMAGVVGVGRVLPPVLVIQLGWDIPSLDRRVEGTE